MELGWSLKKKKKNQCLFQKIEEQCWGLWQKKVFLEGGKGGCEEVEGCNSLTRDVSLENNILLILPRNYKLQI